MILAELVAQRLAAPGVGVSPERLFAIGWPGQRAVLKAAADRVCNAVSSLRTSGLETILKRQDDGYLLDPSATIERR